jgi:hypothetical protein
MATRDDEAREALRDAVVAFLNGDAPMADKMLHAVARWWRWSADELVHAVHALDGACLPGPAVWWLYMTGALAAAPNPNGSELIRAAALRVTAQRECAEWIRRQLDRLPEGTSH